MTDTEGYRTKTFYFEINSPAARVKYQAAVSTETEKDGKQHQFYT